MNASTRAPLLISFSGLDGAGKSTQIDHALALLERSGLRVLRLAFWDDVVVLTRYREGFVHKVYKSERGIGAPGRPVERRDKNVRGWHLTLARQFLYLLDTVHLRQVLARVRRSGADVVLMDRYIYDELVNLPLQNPVCRAFFHCMARLAPRPDLAFLLDADPQEARRRKPEYPVDFMQQCRGWYHRMAALLGSMTTVPPLPLQEAQDRVWEALHHLLALPLSRSA